jgi:uncharacterized protein involved in exopolysaccharide biosynthesis
VLKDLQLRLKDDHPDVVRLKRTVANLQAKVDEEAANAPVLEGAPVSSAQVTRRRRVADLRAEVEQLDKRIVAQQAEEQRLRKVAGGYQQRVEMAPKRESEMIELTRDYGTLQTQYTSLLGKKEESQISANLERRQIGEQFKLLDPARLPEKPFSPNRPRINTLGLVAGLVFAIALIGLVEFRDTSFKTDDDIVTVLSLPVLAVVPVMRSNPERRRAFRFRVATHVGFGGLVVSLLALVVYTYVYAYTR